MSVIASYNKIGSFFCEKTVSANVEANYARFLKHLKSNAFILDAGCGSGRDVKAFCERGFDVHGIDGSEAMVQFASTYTSRSITKLCFEEMVFQKAFDGIWAHASLVHMAPPQLEAIFPRFIDALKPGGYWYMLFKYGTHPSLNGLLPYYFQTEDSLHALLSQFPELLTQEIWVEENPTAKNEIIKWIGCVVKKSPSSDSK